MCHLPARTSSHRSICRPHRHSPPLLFWKSKESSAKRWGRWSVYKKIKGLKKNLLKAFRKKQLTTSVSFHRDISVSADGLFHGLFIVKIQDSGCYTTDEIVSAARMTIGHTHASIVVVMRLSTKFKFKTALFSPTLSCPVTSVTFWHKRLLKIIFGHPRCPWNYLVYNYALSDFFVNTPCGKTLLICKKKCDVVLLNGNDRETIQAPYR